MNNILRVSLFAALLVAVSASPALAQPSECRAAGSLARMKELPEASGLAVSAVVAGRLWSHNDSGQPELVALDTSGKITARVRVSGAKVTDWEAIAVGACGSGSCIYVADIGDNQAARRSVTIYRIPEPQVNASSAAVAEVIQAAYPDGAHDAEALIVADGKILLITKGETGPIGVYRVPEGARPGATAKLERIGGQIQGKAGPTERITDAAASPDGQWIGLRTKTSLVFYRTADFLKGNWREVRRVDLKPLGEPQGEGLAIGAGNVVFLAGEGGGKGQSGTFVNFKCVPSS